MSAFIVICVIYLAVFAQAAFSPLRGLLQTQIDLIPSLMVYVALSFPSGRVTMIAIIAGIATDALSGNPLGTSILPLFLIVMVIYKNRDLLLREQRYAQAVLGAAASAVAPALSCFLLAAMGKHPLLGAGSLWQWFVMACAGAAAAPLWFLCFGKIGGLLQYQVIAESSFRPDREIERGRS